MRVPPSGGVRAEPPADLEAVEAGHLHVEEDQVGPRRMRDFQRLDAIGGLEHADLLILERVSDQLQDGRLVVNHQDRRHASLKSERRARRPSPR